jgi:hypothetical protein
MPMVVANADRIPIEKQTLGGPQALLLGVLLCLQELFHNEDCFDCTEHSTGCPVVDVLYGVED